MSTPEVSRMGSLPWVPIQPNAALPAYGVMAANGVNSVSGAFRCCKLTQIDPGAVLIINGPTPIAKDATGSGMFAGDIPAQALVSGSLVTGGICGLPPNSTSLAGGLTGMRAVAGTSGGAYVVRDSSSATYLGVLNANMTANGSANCTLWFASSGNGTPASSSYSVTAYDWLLNTAANANQIDSGSHVTVTWINSTRRWYVVEAQCQVPD